MTHYFTTALLTGLALGSIAFAGDGDGDRKTVAPLTPLDDAWRFSFSMPGWIPWQQGDTGIGGHVSHIALGPDVIIPRIDMAADVRGEAHKGRFSVLGEFLYMSLSDGIGTKTVVKKVDVQMDQIMGELAVAFRVIESPRGYLDVVGGVRYTNLFQQLVTQPSSERIGAASKQLVDAVSERIATALSSGALRQLIAAKLPDASELGRPSTLPIGPIGGRLPAGVRDRIQGIIDARKAALAAAVQARVQAVGAAAQAAAQQRVDALKKDLSKKIARAVESKLDARLARTDDWFDPFVGLRGRYDLNDKYYVTAKADIGGFGVGADLTWTAEVALGWHLTKNIYSEIGYRALGVDYEKNGLTYDMITHGPQMTLGITF